MGDQVERILFKLEIEEIGVDKTADDLRRRFDLLTKATKALEKEAKRLKTAYDRDDKAITETAKATRQLNAEQKKSVAIQKDLRKEVDATAKARKESAEQLGDVATRGRDVAGALPVVAGIGGARVERLAIGAADLLDAAEGAKLLKLQAPELAANLGLANVSANQLKIGLGVMAVAAAGAAIAIKLIGDASKEAQKSAQAQIETQRQLTELQISTLATDEIKAEQQAIEELNEKRRLERNEIAKDFNARLESINLLQKVGEVSGLANQGLDDYQKRVDELDQEIAASSAVWVELENALDSTTTATNDAVSAERELQDERERAADQSVAFIRRRATLDSDAAKRAETFTRQQLEARKLEVSAEIEKEKQIQETLNARIESGEIESTVAEKAINDSFRKQKALESESKLLDTVVTSGVNAREAEKAAQDLLTKSMEDGTIAAEKYASELEAGLKGIADSARSIAEGTQEANDKAAETNAKRNLDAIQDDEKAALKRTNDLADFYADLAEIDRDAFEERTDILADVAGDLGGVDTEQIAAIGEANKEQRRATEDHLDRLKDIRLRAQSDIRSSAARLDAVGIFEAKKAAEEELAAENEKFEKESRRRDEDLRELTDQLRDERQIIRADGQQRLRDLERQRQRERSELQSAFDEKNRREEQQAALERSQQQQRWALEDQLRAQQISKVQNQTIAHQQNLLNITAAGMGNIQSQFATTLANIATRAAGGTNAGVTAATTNLSRFASSAGTSSLSILGARNLAATQIRQPSRPSGVGAQPAAMGGASIMINVDGTRSPMQVANEIERKLSSVFSGGRAVG